MTDPFDSAQGEPIYDPRDTIGTLVPEVVMSRSLAVRLLDGLRTTLTPRGHLALKVVQEGLGGCGWRSESPSCVERRALIEELAAALEGHG